MKTFLFLPKEKLVEDDRAILKKNEINGVELYSFDKIQLFLSSTIQSINEKVVFLIPSILDPFNAYSYDGIEFALKCYFSFVSNKHEGFHFVIMGLETEAAFWEHCSYSYFLKCPHVDFIQYNVYAIKEYMLKINTLNWSINWEDCISCLRKINVQQPASYKTHHSITNAWCIHRWSKYLGLENIIVQKDIEEHLYFNYLKAIFPVSEINEPTPFTINESGKVLLVDDESGKGWHRFFQSLLRPSTDISFDSIGTDFKNNSRDNIIRLVEDKVKSYDPDVVILDLRLHDEDFDEKDPRRITGNTILSLLNDYNPGIQIILFSASNKVWNYIKPIDVLSDGIIKPINIPTKSIIIKESPELSISNTYTEDSIRHLCFSIKKGLKESAYLKKFYTIKNEFIENMPEDYYSNNPDTTLDLNTAFSLLNEGYLDLALLSIIRSFESYCNFFTINNKGDKLWIGLVYKDVKKKNGTETGRLIYSSQGDNVITSNFKPIFGCYSFQKTNNDGESIQHIVGFDYSETVFSLKDEKSKNPLSQNEASPFKSFSFAVKAVAVLHEQLGNIDDISAVLEWIFIRNQKLAHNGSEYNEKLRPITEGDVLKSLELLNKLSIVGFKRKIKK